jgi:hypothetical protein
MIKVRIEYICDKCGAKKIEKIEIPGYEDVAYAIENFDEAYMPDGWLYYEEDDKSILNCKKCKKEHFPDIDPETGEKAIYIAS